MGYVAMIVKNSQGYYVLSEKGKNLGGPYKNKLEALHRLDQVEYFKTKKAEMTKEANLKKRDYAIGALVALGGAAAIREVRLIPSRYVRPQIRKERNKLDRSLVYQGVK